MKALNRLKAKLEVIAIEQGDYSINSIVKNKILNMWEEETRRYVSHPYKLVHDVKTGIEMTDLNTVLDGNIEPFVAAHINTREAGFYQLVLEQFSSGTALWYLREGKWRPDWKFSNADLKGC
ncbi:hypothetical protein KIW84_062677 [Lathyrus oleraceus]|uniref:Uncharacterized protein n=1 Tax=Pisum sativum TaxID=3888 RepID=A0A9D4W7P2_PEA|nr:hypothetical protein KIW84_062677 [Pisum sativum]